MYFFDRIWLGEIPIANQKNTKKKQIPIFFCWLFVANTPTIWLQFLFFFYRHGKMSKHNAIKDIYGDHNSELCECEHKRLCKIVKTEQIALKTNRHYLLEKFFFDVPSVRWIIRWFFLCAVAIRSFVFCKVFCSASIRCSSRFGVSWQNNNSHYIHLHWILKSYEENCK